MDFLRTSGFSYFGSYVFQARAYIILMQEVSVIMLQPHLPLMGHS